MTNWYYMAEGERKGPVGESVLASMLMEGLQPLETMVWSKGMEGWVQASEVERLVPADEVPPPLPDEKSDQGEPPAFAINSEPLQSTSEKNSPHLRPTSVKGECLTFVMGRDKGGSLTTDGHAVTYRTYRRKSFSKLNFSDEQVVWTKLIKFEDVRNVTFIESVEGPKIYINYHDNTNTTLELIGGEDGEVGVAFKRTFLGNVPVLKASIDKTKVGGGRIAIGAAIGVVSLLIISSGYGGAHFVFSLIASVSFLWSGATLMLKKDVGSKVLNQNYEWEER